MVDFLFFFYQPARHWGTFPSGAWSRSAYRPRTPQSCLLVRNETKFIQVELTWSSSQCESTHIICFCTGSSKTAFSGAAQHSHCWEETLGHSTLSRHLKEHLYHNHLIFTVLIIYTHTHTHTNPTLMLSHSFFERLPVYQNFFSCFLICRFSDLLNVFPLNVLGVSSTERYSSYVWHHS